MSSPPEESQPSAITATESDAVALNVPDVEAEVAKDSKEVTSSNEDGNETDSDDDAGQVNVSVGLG